MKHGNTMNHTDVSRRCGAFFAAMALAFALVAGAALSSCKSNALGDSDRSGEGKGSLAVAIADTASSRLVMPALPTAASVAGYELTLTREGYATRTTGRIADLASFTMQAIEAGSWNLAVAAFDSGGTRVAEGTASVTIERDATVTATVALVPAFARTAGGTGTVSLVFACSGFLANSNDWRVAFTPSAGGTTLNYARDTASVVTIDAVANTATFTATLASGDWDMVFSVKVGATEYVTATDVVKVYDGKTSATATGAPIAISVADLARADRVFYVSNTTTAGNSGRDRAHACTLAEAIIVLNGKSNLTETDPGVIILTENVSVARGSSDPLSIKQPMKIMTLPTLAATCAITCVNDMTTAFIVVSSTGSNPGRLTLKGATIKAATGKKAAGGLVELEGSDGLATLTLDADAVIAENRGGALSGKGGVYVYQGVCEMKTDSVISGNSAMQGGGVYLETTQAKLIMTGGTIKNNNSGNSGGGVYSQVSGASINLKGGSITDNSANINSAEGVGGGILVQSEGDLSVDPSFTGGWKDAVHGNTGVGPDVIRRISVANDLALTSIVSGTYSLPVELCFPDAMTISPKVVNNAANTFVITTQTAGDMLTMASGSTPLFTVSAGTVYIDAEIQGYTGISVAPVFMVNGSGTLVMCEKGKIWDAECGGSPGSAIYMTGGTFRMEGGVIELNSTTTQNGGAIAITAGSASILEGLICGNQTTGANGGAIHLSGGTLAISGGRIGGNTAAQKGGAIYVTGGSLTVSGGEIGYDDSGTHMGNSAGTGGGGAIFATAGTVSLSESARIQFNQANATGASGGGIVMAGTSALTISGTGVRIDKNEANRVAGGVFLADSATMSTPDAAWSDIVKTNVAGIALPNLAREFKGTWDASTIINANSVSEPALVILSGGTSITRSAPIPISKPMAIIGQTNGTFLRDAGLPNTAIFDIGPGGSLTLSGLIGISGQNVASNSPLIDVQENGALYIKDPTVTVAYGVNNQAGGGFGGGIRVGGYFSLSDGWIGESGVPNEALQGGGVYIANNGTMDMSGGFVSANKAGDGAGVFIAQGGMLYHHRGEITNNVATAAGGGIYVEGEYYAHNYSNALNGTISGNEAPANKGGGLYRHPVGRVFVSTDQFNTVQDILMDQTEAVNNVDFNTIAISNTLNNVNFD